MRVHALECLLCECIEMCAYTHTHKIFLILYTKNINYSGLTTQEKMLTFQVHIAAHYNLPKQEKACALATWEKSAGRQKHPHTVGKHSVLSTADLQLESPERLSFHAASTDSWNAVEPLEMPVNVL